MRDLIGKEMRIGDLMIRCETYSRAKDLEFVLVVDIKNDKARLVFSHCSQVSTLKAGSRCMILPQALVPEDITSNLIKLAKRLDYPSIAKDVYSD